LTEADCKFCLIAKHELQSSIVYEDDDVVAFLDIRPLFHGHTLLIPKKHFETFYDLPDDLRDKLFAQAKKIGRAVESSMGAQGSFLAMNNIVSQSVPHVHLHIVPRTKGDGLKGFFWPRRGYKDEQEIKEVQSRIWKAIDLEK
jgi:histidine triad (HIT) family protein